MTITEMKSYLRYLKEIGIRGDFPGDEEYIEGLHKFYQTDLFTISTYSTDRITAALVSRRDENIKFVIPEEFIYRYFILTLKSDKENIIFNVDGSGKYVKSSWILVHNSESYFKISFAEVLELVEPSFKKRLLFHLDLFS